MELITAICNIIIIHYNGAATIHRYTGEPRYLSSRYEYRYLNGISLYRKTTKYFSSKIRNYFYQHSEITVLISLMTTYASTSHFLATGLRPCLVSLRMPSITYLSRWWHEHMHSSKKLSADTVLRTDSKNTRFVCQNVFHSCIVLCIVWWHLYRDMYRIVALVSRYVSYMYRCSPTL